MIPDTVTRWALFAALGAVGFFVLTRGTGNGTGNGKTLAQAMGEEVGRSAVDLVDGIVAGTAVAAGELVGIPPTDPEKCQADRAAGDWWNASFSCPAGTFLGSAYDRLFK